MASLININGVQFTRREMDVLACLFSIQGTSKIASILSVALRTVVTHSRNIRRKIGCNSREGIIDFLEKSEEISYVREYYVNLVAESFFKKSLQEIAKLNPTDTAASFLICCTNEALRDNLLRRLPPHLSYFDIPITIYDGPSKDLKPSSITLTFLQKRKLPQVKGELWVDVSGAPDYYAAVFNILKRIFSPSQIEEIAMNFWEHVKPSRSMASSSTAFENEPSAMLGIKKEKPLKNFLFSSNGYWVYAFIFILIGSGVGFFKIQRPLSFWHAGDNLSSHGRRQIRSDLIIPSDAFLLSRPEYIKRIGKNIFSQKDIRTIALVGMGGAGKTVLARQYAAQQKTPVVWELNAETLASLQNSFSHLAQALAQTDTDKRRLREIQETTHIAEREMQMLNFVKERLQRLSKWLLIYDNVENISDIQRYFPQDKATWGEGSVIVTTRNETIQNNSHLKEIIPVDVLSPKEKLDLFTRIMSRGSDYLPTSLHLAQTRDFLEHIPSFPLDVSVAAYYLKNMNPSYEGYLENLRKQASPFDDAQKRLLKEAGDYTYTRYQIVTLSLQQILKEHKDFKDLVGFISFLDSQHIPRNLLNSYKDITLVDNFINCLKRYSLIIANTAPSTTAEVSVHRSTQSIIFHFFLEHTSADAIHNFLDEAVRALEKTIQRLLPTEELPALRMLALHCEALLKHHIHLSSVQRGRIKAALASIYTALSEDIPKQRRLLDEALTDLKETPSFYARALSYKGAFLWEIGDFKAAEQTLKESLDMTRSLDQEDDPRTAQSLLILGAIYRETGRDKEALQIVKRISSYFSGDQYEAAAVFGLLGNIYRGMRNYTQAVRAYKKGLDICRHSHPHEGSPQEAALLADLGELYQDYELYEEAQKCHVLSLRLYRQFYPKNSRFVARGLRHLGATYNASGNFSKALECLQNSLQIYVMLLGTENFKTQWVYRELGKSYLGLKHLSKAKEILEKCLVFYETHLREEPYWANSTLPLLGCVYLETGEVEKGERLIQKGIKNLYQAQESQYLYPILEKIAEIYEKKAVISEKAGNFMKATLFKGRAEGYLHQALHFINSQFWHNSRSALRVQNKLKTINCYRLKPVAVD